MPATDHMRHDLDDAWALGTVCESARFYTYIVPRPHVDSTALVNASRTVGGLFAKIRSSPTPEERRIAIYRQARAAAWYTGEIFPPC